jgi:hypothetical protein
MSSSVQKRHRISPLGSSIFTGELGEEKVIRKKAKEAKYMELFQE